MPSRRRVYRQAGAPKHFLFAKQATFYEVRLNAERALKKELAAFKGDELLHRPTEAVIEEIVRRYTLNTPTLDRDNITQLPPEQTEMQVPAFTQNGVFSGPGPHFVPATAYRINIPFSGDPNLFDYSASGFGNHIDAKLVDDGILLTHMTEHPDAETIKKDFDNRMTQIDTALSFIRTQADEWNRLIPNLVKPAIEKRQTTLQRDSNISLGYPMASPPPPRTVIPTPSPTAKISKNTYDVFLSHASEDKEIIARPLYEALTAEGVSVWFDEAVLKLGDSLSGKIDEGLAKCPHGIIIISPSFLDKPWTQKELSGLVARETANGAKTILPIWHNIDLATLVRRSLTLADRMAGNSIEGVPALVKKILEVIRQS